MNLLKALTSNGREKILPESEDEMSHTKSKAKIYKGFDRLYIYADQLPGCPRLADIPDTGVIPEEERIANAERFVRCWNDWGDLIEANALLIQQRDNTHKTLNDVIAGIRAVFGENVAIRIEQAIALTKT